MVWGRQDPHIPREGGALIYNALSDAGAHFQWHEFNAAHAFLRDEGPCYDPAAVRICYDMVLELFTRTLNKEYKGPFFSLHLLCDRGLR